MVALSLDMFRGPPLPLRLKTTNSTLWLSTLATGS
jgi:hypothetical protein